MKSKINKKRFGVYVIVLSDNSIYVGSGCDSHNINGSELRKRIYQFERLIHVNRKVKEKIESGCTIKDSWFLKENMSRDKAFDYEKRCIKCVKSLWKDDALNIRDF